MSKQIIGLILCFIAGWIVNDFDVSWKKRLWYIGAVLLGMWGSMLLGVR